LAGRRKTRPPTGELYRGKVRRGADLFFAGGDFWGAIAFSYTCTAGTPQRMTWGLYVNEPRVLLGFTAFACKLHPE